MERFLRYNQICDEKLPLMKIRKNKPKSEISLSQLLITRDIHNLHLEKKNRNFLISTSNYQIYTKFTSIHMFLRMTKRMKYSKKKLSKSKMAANYGQRFVLGIKSINMPFLVLS